MYIDEKEDENVVKVLRHVSNFNWPILCQRELGFKTFDNLWNEHS